MNKKFIPFLVIILLLFVSLMNAKDLNLSSLGKEIIQYNREGRQKLSQKKLSDLLFSGDLTQEEEANVLYYLGTTYRGVGDYIMCIDYLNKSAAIAKNFSKDNILRIKLDYEYAFSYFDNKEYKKCSEAMKRIAAQKYSKVIPEDQSYIFMQEGYLFLMNKDYDNAEKKYTEALNIMKTANYCNLPIVLVKMMELYNQKKNIKKVESIYQESIKISEGCSILKYETLTASQMEVIYKQNNLLEKAYSVGIKVDSLRKLEDLENRVSEMHITDRKYLERQELSEIKTVFWGKIGALTASIIVISFIGYSFFKSRKLKIDKLKLREEIFQMKENFDSYAKKPSLDEKYVNKKHTIVNFEKLTDRQKELIKLMADGLSNKEIAEKLFITENTVKYHIKNIYSILELKDRKEFFKKQNQT